MHAVQGAFAWPRERKIIAHRSLQSETLLQQGDAREIFVCSSLNDGLLGT
jgi:hypothetical protein